jgi:hypothetical protein
VEVGLARVGDTTTSAEDMGAVANGRVLFEVGVMKMINAWIIVAILLAPDGDVFVQMAGPYKSQRECINKNPKWRDAECIRFEELQDTIDGFYAGSHPQ